MRDVGRWPQAVECRSAVSYTHLDVYKRQVLTGLNPSFDRMKQVTAYARVVNPRIVVAMGGPLARMLPNLSRRYFDYVCSADVEQLVAVVDAVFGPGHAAEVPIPRHDLLPRSRIIGYAETSRNCNFRCSFCSMTAEDRKFMTYDLDDVRRQIDALGYRQCVMFLDQNFFGGPRAYFREMCIRDSFYRLCHTCLSHHYSF